jgi:uncharacterized LabA/DUF88 family protein
MPNHIPLSKPKTIVYIDGFNLYYGMLNKHRAGLKWLDINKLLMILLPNNEIQKIKFFTARVSGKYDPSKPNRQEIYFRALKTLPNVNIIEGTFLFKWAKINITNDVKMLARVPEEKGTDVNLAVHLVNDAHNKIFDVAVIVSNDSDLAEAIKVNQKLIRNASFKKMIRETAILNSQFPVTLTDSTGQITKPPSW